MHSPDRKDGVPPRLTITERPSDFGTRRGVVFYNGCTCCCCCCLWSAGAAVGATAGFLVARRRRPGYRDLPGGVRRGFWLGGFLGAVAGLAPFLWTVAAGRGHLSEVVIGLAILAPLLMIPFTIGALVGAYRARRRLVGSSFGPVARPERDGDAAASQALADLPDRPICRQDISLRPVWRMVLFMWIGAVLGTVLGILLFLPLASRM